MSSPPRSTPTPPEKPVTVPEFRSARNRGAKLCVVTAYDYTFARLFDAAGVDAVLVGDSLGMVVQGYPHCLKVTLEQMVYHTQCVARGLKRALLIGDMPFLSYQLSPQQALESAGRLVQDGNAHAVKLEGGEKRALAIEAITSADIPVMGHIGLTPQSLHRLGGYRVQRDAEQLRADAMAVQAAGAFAIVLECIPAALARDITASLSIPTIGIGAGAGCDGQVLVGPDLLGLFDDVKPKFVKHYGELGQSVRLAIETYCREVRGGGFPGTEHEFH